MDVIWRVNYSFSHNMWYSNRCYFISNYGFVLLCIYRFFLFIASDLSGDGGSSSEGCPSPDLTLNGTRVVPRLGMSPDFLMLSEVKFPADFPSGKGSATVTSSSPDQVMSRICKIKCVSGQWVGPLCQGLCSIICTIKKIICFQNTYKR